MGTQGIDDEKGCGNVSFYSKLYAISWSYSIGKLDKLSIWEALWYFYTESIIPK